ncbi:MAG: lysostaphin resistance A-like protein [Candidatus Sericytochromatia bacterium]
MERKIILRILIFQELGLILLGLIWLLLRNRMSFYSKGILSLDKLNPFIGININLNTILISIIATIVLLSLSLSIVYTYAPLKKALEVIETMIISKLKPVDIIPIALLSGVGEEFFFRGILQNEIGIIPSSLIFGLLHFPGKDFWIYSFWAFFGGLYFGNIYSYTNNLFIVVLAHTLNNLISLTFWIYLRKKSITK